MCTFATQLIALLAPMDAKLTPFIADLLYACLKSIVSIDGVACSPLGSVARLAPTLKHLSIWEYSDVEGLDCLTNLDVLEILC